jgi:demethylmenaquinone methyltransferase/2-methoxy-6-polyprenyl-1,4-benzoquinol methylase
MRNVNMELGFVKDMFNAIAPRYDFLNRLLSLRQDVSWRRRMVRMLFVPERGRVLDAACGTGDVMIELLCQKPWAGLVTGIDFAPEMLRIARQKIDLRKMGSKTALVAADTLALPMAEQSVDAVTIAFGIRNIMDRKAVLKKFHESLKPGGMLAVLELATPRHHLLRRLYLAYFQKLLPTIGGRFSRNRMAYRYLPASVVRFPEPEAFAALMASAGFCQVQWRCMTLGLATLHTGRKTE